MFRVVSLPIIRSAYNCIYSIWYLSNCCCYFAAIAASSRTMLPATGRQHRRCIIPQAVTHTLVLLKMGKIIAGNMLS